MMGVRVQVLKPACVRALRRIFHLCDSNRDGFLDNNELNAFQNRCFSSPLQQTELEGIKELVREQDPTNVNELGIAEGGFLFLHTRFIQKGRLETTWGVLRAFGYGEDLSLRDDHLRPAFPVPGEYSVELSPKGYQFLTDLFQIHDKVRLALRFSSLQPGHAFG